MSSSPNRSRVGSRWLRGLAAAAAIALAVAGGWSLGRHQAPGRSGEDPKRAVVEREVRSLRLRLDRQEASDADRQRLLELLVALERKAEAIRLLEPMADLGVPAGIAFMAAPLLIAMQCLSGAALRRRDRAFPAVAVAASMSMAVHAMAGFALQIPAVAVAFAVLLGIGAAQSWRTNMDLVR